MSSNTAIKGEITETTTFRGMPAITVKMITGRIERNLTAKCIRGGFNSGLVVGSKGIMEYVSSASFGMWIFKPEVL